MKSALIWVLTWSVLGPVPESGEWAKYSSRQECEAALQQKREEYQAQKKRIVASCHQSTK